MLVLDFKLANALLLSGQWFANTWLPLLLGIELREPASDGRLAQLHVPADFADVEVLMADHLYDLQLETGVEDSSLLFRRGDCPGDFHLSACAKLLEQDTPSEALSQLPKPQPSHVGDERKLLVTAHRNAPHELVFTERYVRAAAKFLKRHPDMARGYEKTLELLALNPHHPSLRLYALAGRLACVHSVSINLSYRITLHFQITERKIVPINVGDHDEGY